MSRSLLAACAAVLIIIVFLNGGNDQNDPNEQHSHEAIHFSAEGYQLYRNLITTGNAEGIIDPAYMDAGWEQAQTALANRVSPIGLTWGFEGPDNQGGRTRAIIVDKDSANVVWAGSTTGGLYRSTNHGDYWVPVPAWNNTVGMSQAISCMTQALDGTIYVGTGCSFEAGSPGVGSSISLGNGIWYSTDYGLNWTQVTGSDLWSPINEIAADPNEISKVWVGCNSGLSSVKVLDTGVEIPAPGSPTISGTVLDLQVANDLGKTVVLYGYSLGGVHTYVNKDTWGAGSWMQASGVAPGQLPFSGRTRIEYAISPQNPSKMYAVTVDNTGALEGAYMTEDGGTNWFEVAGVSTPSFPPFGSQGNYNCILSVDPANEDRVLLGGIDLYEWERTPGAMVDWTTFTLSGGWSQLTLWSAPTTSSIYVHADNHELVWGQDEVLYVGNDGGVFRSYDHGSNYAATNLGYTTLQPYGIAFSKEGYVMGGTQDNGTMVIDHSLTSYWQGYEVLGGDGFDCDISHINTDAWFAATQYGGATRSELGADPLLWAVSNPWHAPSDFLGVSGTTNFFTPFRLAEWPMDPNSEDSLYVVLDPTNYDLSGPSPVVTYVSQSGGDPLTYVEQPGDNFAMDDTVVLVDPRQSWYAFQRDNGVAITRDALKFSINPHWLVVAPGITDAKVFEFNDVTQDLFIGTWGGDVWRISGLDQLYSWLSDDTLSAMADQEMYPSGPDIVTTITKIFDGTSMYPITDLSTVRGDAGRLLITRGAFTTGDHLYQTFTADNDPATTGAGNFVSIQGDLGVNIPVYTAVYDQGDPDNIIIGTEYGIFSSDNGGVTWSMDHGDMGLVPVYDLRIQQFHYSEGAVNPNMIYAGTHGRGIWSSSTILDTDRPWDEIAVAEQFDSQLSIYPNPMTDFGTVEFVLKAGGQVFLDIIDVNGRMVSTEQRTLSKGEHSIELDVAELPAGTYMIGFRSNEQVDAARFVKR